MKKKVEKKDGGKLEDIYAFLDEKPKLSIAQKERMITSSISEDIDFKPMDDIQRWATHNNVTPVEKIEDVVVSDDPPVETMKKTATKSSISEDIKDDIIKGGETKTDLANTCELLLNEKWRKRKTRLRDRSIPALTTLETLAVLYDVEWLRSWIDSYTEYVTSEDGKGRQDIVDIAKYSIDKETTMRKEMMEFMGKR